MQDIVANYTLSGNDKPSSPFTVVDILKALAFNKHNDHTTTYSLLHKKWLNSRGASREDKENGNLITVTPENYLQVAENILNPEK